MGAGETGAEMVSRCLRGGWEEFAVLELNYGVPGIILASAATTRVA